jgi:hypothetical protein
LSLSGAAELFVRHGTYDGEGSPNFTVPSSGIWYAVFYNWYDSMFEVNVEAELDFETEEMDLSYITFALNIGAAVFIVGVVVVFYGRYKKQHAATRPSIQALGDWCRYCGLRRLPLGTQYCPNCGKDTRPVRESVGLQ